MEEAEKNAKLYKEGNKIREELSEKAKLVKVEYQEKLSKLRGDLEEADRIKKEKELIKVEIEHREKSALEKYEPPKKEEKSEEKHMLERPGGPGFDEMFGKSNDDDEDKDLDPETREAKGYFTMLDTDDNGIVTAVELQGNPMFDKNHDGEVSNDEAKYWLENREEVNLAEFINIAWRYIKPITMKEAGKMILYFFYNFLLKFIIKVS